MAAAKGKMKVKKGDEVVVLTGRDKGKKGEVLRVDRARNRVLVQGVNMVKRHQRPTMTSPGGINEFEAAIHASNVAVVDPESGDATRVTPRGTDRHRHPGIVRAPLLPRLRPAAR